MSKTQQAIAKVVDDAFEKHRALTWQQIVSEVSARMKIDNWMKVRSHIQRLINTNVIKRTSDVRVEEYVVIE